MPSDAIRYVISGDEMEALSRESLRNGKAFVPKFDNGEWFIAKTPEQGWAIRMTDESRAPLLEGVPLLTGHTVYNSETGVAKVIADEDDASFVCKRPHFWSWTRIPADPAQ